MTNRPKIGETVEVSVDGVEWVDAIVEEDHLDDDSYQLIVVSLGGRRKPVLEGHFRIKKQTNKPGIEHQPSPDKQTRG